MKFKKSQSGRSMVEMLGVLAIIGVLSVGGIAGYSLSMRRHRANQVVDILSKYALITYNQCQQKVLNNEFSSITECDPSNTNGYFLEQDLGAFPAGVTQISFSEITSNADGVDAIVISAHFDDDKLCQAVGSIAGASCDESSCVTFPIKQN